MDQGLHLSDARYKKIRALIQDLFGATTKPASTWAAATAGRFNGTPLVVASATITPKVTGRLLIVITASLQNDSDSGQADVQVSVTHGADVTTPADFGPIDYIVNDNGGGRQWGTVAMNVDLGRIAIPVIFPVGTPVTINTVFNVTSGQSVQWLDGAIQMAIIEQATL